MTKRILFLLLVVAASASVLVAQQNPDFHREIPPFKVAGNLYWVGTADLSVYLINTPQGNILINSDFPEDLPTIKKNIDKLGFKYSDTKILLASHAHNDHDAGIGIMKKETGAKLMISRPGAKVDRILHDGDYPQIADDYMKTFKVLKSLPCDLFLGAHGNNFGLLAKLPKMKAGSPNPLIDPAGYKAYVVDREAAFQKEFDRQKKNPGSPAA